MCLDCIKEPLIDRGDTTLESGCYLLNLNPCNSCGVKQPPLSKFPDTTTASIHSEESTEIEEIEFRHLCPSNSCQHVIADHYYKFEVDDEKQTYLMSCALCGKGSKTIFHNGDNLVDNFESEEKLKERKKKTSVIDLFSGLQSQLEIVQADETNDETSWD
eukprot:maker-scaffold_3-snap-gene-18.47-mRNA-1 protein AED:0.02 eAED:0.02 QI:109/1/1/1/1/1/4/269/159